MSEFSLVLTDDLLSEFVEYCREKKLDPTNFPYTVKFQLKVFLYEKELLTNGE